MKELIILTTISGLAFLFFLLTLFLGFKRKNRRLKITSFFLFVFFIVMIIWTGFTFISKTYHKVAETFKPRTGEEIYDALFEKRQTDCVKVLNHQDQVIPKIDYAIWLEFVTCSQEMNQILLKHDYASEKLSINKLGGVLPSEEVLKWFNPRTLGDTILFYEYASEDRRNIQTIWMNLDSTKVFVRDVLD